MAKCGDCWYFGFCKKYIDPEETFPEIGGCHTFTDKADLVEVVRCKDCKKYREPFCMRNDSKNGYLTVVPPDHFCSYGERRNNDQE